MIDGIWGVSYPGESRGRRGRNFRLINGRRELSVFVPDESGDPSIMAISSSEMILMISKDRGLNADLFPDPDDLVPVYQ